MLKENGVTCDTEGGNVSFELPPDVLRLLCIFASGHEPEGKLQHVPPSFALKNTPELQALGSCCKLLKGIFDNLRPSIHFHATLQRDVEPYLRKLRPMIAVSVEYSDDESDIKYSLKSLHKILPRLTSLALSYSDSSSEEPVRKFDKSLLAWRSTLQCLHLYGLEIDPGRTGGSFDFLRKLPDLKELKLRYVLPALRTEDIEKCTRLVKLSLAMDPDTVDDDEDSSMLLDLTTCESLQELSCANYNLEGLILTGLTALQRLECSCNAIEDLDISTCTALQSLTCMNNSIEQLDVRACPNLVELVCDTNPMRKLQVSGCTHLTLLSCGDTGLEALDLTGCTALKDLLCGGNNLDKLDLKSCPHLETLDLAGSESLLSLSLQGFLYLRTLQLKWSGIKSLDVTGCTALESVSCDMCCALEVVCVRGCCKLVSLTATQCPSLRIVDGVGCDSLELVACEGSGEFSGATVASVRGQ